MVHAYHVIFGAYGFWLPNDPRGSWSTFVKSWELARFGPATKTTERRSLAKRPHDHTLRQAAKQALTYPAVRLTGVQARAVGNGFAKAVEKCGLTLWACSIMPEHVHLVVSRHRYDVEQIVNLLKGEATRKLKADGVHPLADYRRPDGRIPKPWADGQWKVFLDDVADIPRAVKYVENNPLKERKPRQHWSFVSTFTESSLRTVRSSPLARG